MRIKLIFVTLVVTLVITIGLFGVPASGTKNIKNIYLAENGLEDESVSPYQQQIEVSSSQIFLDTLEILEDRATKLGSWALPPSEDDSRTFYGITGGMAGIGLKILELIDKDLSWIETDIVSRLLLIAEDIESDLFSAVYINSTHAYWTIHNETSYVDLGWDFGLAGISAFYSKLFNLTSNVNYRDTSFKILTSIRDLSNKTSGLHWNSSLLLELENTPWFDPLDHEILVEFGASNNYLGNSLGTAGVGKSALVYLQMTNDSSNGFVQSILYDVVDFLLQYENSTGIELSYPVSAELEFFTSTGYANGMIGFADFYMDLYQYNSSNIYLDKVYGLFNWLNGTYLELSRYQLSWISEEVGFINSIELGLNYGLAGIGDTLLKFYLLTNDSDFLTIAEYISNSILITGREDNGNILFGEKVSLGIPRSIGSNSWAFGMSGLYEFFYDLAQVLDDQQLKETSSRIKSYLKSNIIEEGEFVTFTSYRSNKIENNPVSGLPGFLYFLTIQSPGRLLINDLEISFDKTELGNSLTENIILHNIGDLAINIIINKTTTDSIFIVSNQDVSIAANGQISISIEFRPVTETSYSNELNIFSENEKYVLPLKGNSFDIPELLITASKPNNSELINSQTINFNIRVTDTSVIFSASVSIDNGNSLLLDTTGNDYSFDWKTNGLANGTHTLVFSAKDVNGNTGMSKMIYNIQIITTPLADKVFSDNNRNILIGAASVLLIVALVVTRKYMSGNSS